MRRVSKKKTTSVGKNQRTLAHFFSQKPIESKKESSQIPISIDSDADLIIKSEKIASHSDIKSESITDTEKPTFLNKTKPRQLLPKSKSSVLKSTRTTSLLNFPSRKSLFYSQGSFDESDPDAELHALLNPPKLNSFKPNLKSEDSFVSSRSISPSESPLSSQNTVVTSTQNSTIIKASSSDHQLSFTNNFKKEQNSSILSTSNFSTLRKTFKPTNKRKLVAAKKTDSAYYGSYTLSLEQKEVVRLIVKEGKNIFYTGAAGTGKSLVLRTIISQLRGRYGKQSVAITASTGLAANNIGGITLHRWAGIGLGHGKVADCVKSIKKKPDVLACWKNTRVLIIDEISMIDGMFLEKLNMIAKLLRDGSKPFGGIQLVFTGDFFQLPPVQKRNYNANDNEKSLSPVFCFQTEMWKTCTEHNVLLTEVFRQKDDDLVSILNQVRFGEIDNSMADKLKELQRPIEYSDGIQPTELYSTRREVDLSNSRQLDNLPGVLYTFESRDMVTKGFENLLDSSVMAEKKVFLKEDAQVMMLKNKPDAELVNGSLGKILFFATENLIRKMNELYGARPDEATILDMRLASKVLGNPAKATTKEYLEELNSRPIVRLEKLKNLINFSLASNPKEPVYPFVKWSIGINSYNYLLMLPERFVVDIAGEDLGMEREQIPLILCYALSIHKSQGQTIQRLKVDLKHTFEAGQVYVALSRAVSKDCLQIVNFNKNKIKANESVKNFYKKLEKKNTKSKTG